MKKVWILEKFETHEEMIKYFEDYKKMLETTETDDAKAIEHFKEFLAKYEKAIEENPNGRWVGFDGKSIYKVFCNVARESIKRNPNAKFRVIEAEIEDDAKYWAGYKFVKENEGVLRYLMATKY